MSVNNSQIAEMAPELSITTLTGGGAYDLIGILIEVPAIIIFDNIGLVSVGISKNGTDTWKTFPAGECLVLDLRNQQGQARNFGFRKGTSFFATGSAGACDFRISYIYAEDL
jgi:hypothetical protein